MHYIKTAFTKLINLLLPTHCLLCASALGDELICTGCLCDLPYMHNHTRCQQCSLSLNSYADLCGYCLRQPPAFSNSHIPFSYGHPLDRLIHKFKYRRHLTTGKLLGQLLADYLHHYSQEHDDWQEPDIIIPVPMHWLRRWQRGFNQAEILGRYIAQELEIPMATNIIQRRHKTLVQKELTRNDRQKNLRKAFGISVKKRTYIKGKRIAIVDDVVTTTATTRELSELLINAGAINVQIWALARTQEK